MTERNLFVLIELSPEGNTIKRYYDEDSNLLAGGTNDMLFPSPELANYGDKFLDQLDNIDESQEISLTELDKELDEVSRVLGISKSDVISMSKVELDAVIKNKEVIDLSDDKDLSPEEIDTHNNAVLERLEIKQEIDLDKKIDDKYTLADVLDVEKGSQLIVVDSDEIANSEHTTRFSCAIKGPDGNIRSADMLTQAGGKNSNKNVYETNRDGSKVENKVVQSSFAINSEKFKNGIITVRHGQMGTIEVGYGQMDKTEHQYAFTQRLETREIYPVTSRVREEFSKDKGEYNIDRKIDEIKEHEEHGCGNMTLAEADGDPYTGHIHSDEAVDIILEDEQVGGLIAETYNREDIKKHLESNQKDNPDCNFEELIEITKNELVESAKREHDLGRK